MSAKYAYPAIFTPEDDGGFSVRFPDLEGCFNSEGGESLNQTYVSYRILLPLKQYPNSPNDRRDYNTTNYTGNPFFALIGFCNIWHQILRTMNDPRFGMSYP